MDESYKQLAPSTRASLPLGPGKALRVDDEYIRHWVTDIFMAVEPIAGKRWVSVTERIIRVDWAMFIKGLLDDRCFSIKKNDKSIDVCF